MNPLAEQVATTLPARYYTDSGLFKDEVERFFCQTWICAGRADQIKNAGDYFLREIAGESIILTRDNDGSVRAFFNVCRHRGTRICAQSEGQFARRIQCGYHGWTYGLDGRLIGAPHMHEGLCREDYGLNAVHVDKWDGNIFINLSAQPSPLATQLADLPQKFANWRMGDLRRYQRKEYTVAANWKLIVLNYNECLHCPVLHPALSAITNYLSGDNDSPHQSYIGGSMEFQGGAETMSVDGKRRRDYLPGLIDADLKKVYYYAVFPNLFLSLHPDYVMTHVLWPLDSGRTEIVCEFLFAADEVARPGFDASDAVDFWDATNKQDWGVCERTQLGVQSSSYDRGRLSRLEWMTHIFDQFVVERLTAC